MRCVTPLQRNGSSERPTRNTSAAATAGGRVPDDANSVDLRRGELVNQWHRGSAMRSSAAQGSDGPATPIGGERDLDDQLDPVHAVGVPQRADDCEPMSAATMPTRW